MVCIYCGHKTSVANSRSSVKSKSTWRRRSCKSCNAVFTTREFVDLESSLRVVTPLNTLEPFLRDKLFVSLFLSLSHRKTALTDATGLTDTLLTQIIAHNNKGIVSSKEIASTAYSTLERFDKISAVYYQAHHSN